jgi:hypothetical protein
MGQQGEADKRTGLEPELLAFLLCDDVIHDAVTGKRSIIGTFSTVYLEKVPGVYHRFAMYVALTEGRGTQDLRIVISHIESGQTVLELRGKMRVGDPTAVGELGLRIPVLPLPKTGAYSVDLYANEKLVACRKFHVTRVAPRRRGQPPPGPPGDRPGGPPGQPPYPPGQGPPNAPSGPVGEPPEYPPPDAS